MILFNVYFPLFFHTNIIILYETINGTKYIYVIIDYHPNPLLRRGGIIEITPTENTTTHIEILDFISMNKLNNLV